MQLKEDDDDLPAFDIGMTSTKDSTDVVELDYDSDGIDVIPEEDVIPVEDSKGDTPFTKQSSNLFTNLSNKFEPIIKSNNSSPRRDTMSPSTFVLSRCSTPDQTSDITRLFSESSNSAKNTSADVDPVSSKSVAPTTAIPVMKPVVSTPTTSVSIPTVPTAATTVAKPVVPSSTIPVSKPMVPATVIPVSKPTPTTSVSNTSVPSASRPVAHTATISVSKPAVANPTIPVPKPVAPTTSTPVSKSAVSISTLVNDNQIVLAKKTSILDIREEDIQNIEDKETKDWISYGIDGMKHLQKLANHLKVNGIPFDVNKFVTEEFPLHVQYFDPLDTDHLVNALKSDFINKKLREVCDRYQPILSQRSKRTKRYDYLIPHKAAAMRNTLLAVSVVKRSIDFASMRSSAKSSTCTRDRRDKRRRKASPEHEKSKRKKGSSLSRDLSFDHASSSPLKAPSCEEIQRNIQNMSHYFPSSRIQLLDQGKWPESISTKSNVEMSDKFSSIKLRDRTSRCATTSTAKPKDVQPEPVSIPQEPASTSTNAISSFWNPLVPATQSKSVATFPFQHIFQYQQLFARNQNFTQPPSSDMSQQQAVSGKNTVLNRYQGSTAVSSEAANGKSTNVECPATGATTNFSKGLILDKNSRNNPSRLGNLSETVNVGPIHQRRAGKMFIDHQALTSIRKFNRQSKTKSLSLSPQLILTDTPKRKELSTRERQIAEISNFQRGQSAKHTSDQSQVAPAAKPPAPATKPIVPATKPTKTQLILTETPKRKELSTRERQIADLCYVINSLPGLSAKNTSKSFTAVSASTEQSQVKDKYDPNTSVEDLVEVEDQGNMGHFNSVTNKINSQRKIHSTSFPVVPQNRLKRSNSILDSVLDSLEKTSQEKISTLRQRLSNLKAGKFVQNTVPLVPPAKDWIQLPSKKPIKTNFLQDSDLFHLPTPPTNKVPPTPSLVKPPNSVSTKPPATVRILTRESQNKTVSAASSSGELPDPLFVIGGNVTKPVADGNTKSSNAVAANLTRKQVLSRERVPSAKLLASTIPPAKDKVAKAVGLVSAKPTLTTPSFQSKGTASSKPIGSSSKPIAQAAKPIAPTAKAIEPATKPVAPATKPVAPAAKPVATAPKPIAPVAKSTATTSKPIAPAAKPVALAPKSVASAAKPSAPVAKPSVPVSLTRQAPTNKTSTPLVLKAPAKKAATPVSTANPVSAANPTASVSKLTVPAGQPAKQPEKPVSAVSQKPNAPKPVAEQATKAAPSSKEKESAKKDTSSCKNAANISPVSRAQERPKSPEVKFLPPRQDLPKRRQKELIPGVIWIKPEPGTHDLPISVPAPVQTSPSSQPNQTSTKRCSKPTCKNFAPPDKDLCPVHQQKAALLEIRQMMMMQNSSNPAPSRNTSSSAPKPDTVPPPTSLATPASVPNPAQIVTVQTQSAPSQVSVRNSVTPPLVNTVRTTRSGSARALAHKNNTDNARALAHKNSTGNSAHRQNPGSDVPLQFLPPTRDLTSDWKEDVKMIISAITSYAAVCPPVPHQFESVGDFSFQRSSTLASLDKKDLENIKSCRKDLGKNFDLHQLLIARSYQAQSEIHLYILTVCIQDAIGVMMRNNDSGTPATRQLIANYLNPEQEKKLTIYQLLNLLFNLVYTSEFEAVPVVLKLIEVVGKKRGHDFVRVLHLVEECFNLLQNDQLIPFRYYLHNSFYSLILFENVLDKRLTNMTLTEICDKIIKLREQATIRQPAKEPELKDLQKFGVTGEFFLLRQYVSKCAQSQTQPLNKEFVQSIIAQKIATRGSSGLVPVGVSTAGPTRSRHSAPPPPAATRTTAPRNVTAPRSTAPSSMSNPPISRQLSHPPLNTTAAVNPNMYTSAPTYTSQQVPTSGYNPHNQAPPTSSYNPQNPQQAGPPYHQPFLVGHPQPAPPQHQQQTVPNQTIQPVAPTSACFKGLTSDRLAITSPSQQKMIMEKMMTYDQYVTAHSNMPRNHPHRNQVLAEIAVKKNELHRFEQQIAACWQSHQQLMNQQVGSQLGSNWQQMPPHSMPPHSMPPNIMPPSTMPCSVAQPSGHTNVADRSNLVMSQQRIQQIQQLIKDTPQYNAVHSQPQSHPQPHPTNMLSHNNTVVPVNYNNMPPSVPTTAGGVMLMNSQSLPFPPQQPQPQLQPQPHTVPQPQQVQPQPQPVAPGRGRPKKKSSPKPRQQTKTPPGTEVTMTVLQSNSPGGGGNPTNNTNNTTINNPANNNPAVTQNSVAPNNDQQLPAAPSSERKPYTIQEPGKQERMQWMTPSEAQALQTRLLEEYNRKKEEELRKAAENNNTTPNTTVQTPPNNNPSQDKTVPAISDERPKKKVEVVVIEVDSDDDPPPASTSVIIPASTTTPAPANSTPAPVPVQAPVPAPAQSDMIPVTPTATTAPTSLTSDNHVTSTTQSPGSKPAPPSPGTKPAVPAAISNEEYGESLLNGELPSEQMSYLNILDDLCDYEARNDEAIKDAQIRKRKAEEALERLTNIGEKIKKRRQQVLANYKVKKDSESELRIIDHTSVATPSTATLRINPGRLAPLSEAVKNIIKQ